jgi:Bacterial SH3 domain
MTRISLLVSLMIALLLSCAQFSGADTGSINCQAGESYAYLYQSADNFQVLGNIRCGQKVEILDAQNNAMVRVRTADGKEGYVSKSELAAIASGTQQQIRLLLPNPASAPRNLPLLRPRNGL